LADRASHTVLVTMSSRRWLMTMAWRLRTAAIPDDKAAFVLARAALEGDPPPTVSAQLLSRLGQKLTDLPVSVTPGQCEVSLALAGFAPGDYVVLMAARQGDESVTRYTALRVLR
jgi:hypothetical protein